MASFAKIGLNNKVIEVLSVHNNELLDSNGVEQEINGIDFLTKLTGWSIWVQTSYNKNFRKNHASIGMTYDEDRDAFNLTQKKLRANSNAAENDNSAKGIDLLSNGFKLRTSNGEFNGSGGGIGQTNNSGGSYIYMAFAENPFVTSTGIPATAR